MWVTPLRWPTVPRICTWHWFSPILTLTQIERAEARIDAVAESITGAVDESATQLAKPARTRREQRRQMALRALLGVVLTAIPTIGIETALTIASEVGPDLSRLASAAHFCSWPTLAPLPRCLLSLPLYSTRIPGGACGDRGLDNNNPNPSPPPESPFFRLTSALDWTLSCPMRGEPEGTARKRFRPLSVSLTPASLERTPRLMSKRMRD